MAPHFGGAFHQPLQHTGTSDPQTLLTHTYMSTLAHSCAQTHTQRRAHSIERHDPRQLTQCQWQMLFLYMQLYLLSHEYFAVYYEWNKTQLRICHCYKYIVIYINRMWKSESKVSSKEQQMDFGSTYTVINNAIPQCTSLCTCALTHSLRLDLSMSYTELLIYVYIDFN